MAMVRELGAAALRKASGFSYSLGFLYRILKESVLFFRKRQVAYRVFVMQILFTGVEALGTCAVLALALGAVIIIQGYSLLPQFGQSRLMYTILIIVITRELGPLLTAFIVNARSGTAIATELGSMVVSHEIEAYVSVGIDPISYLAAPRVLGVTASMLILDVYFNLFGLLGSFLVARFIKPIEFSEYFSSLAAALSGTDIVSGLIKSLVFGVIVAVSAVYQGFAVERASTEIPKAGYKSVGKGFTYCIIADAILTLIYYI
jgi:phospholipid/cholesterol/gamma-HCH transport system permease protein